MFDMLRRRRGNWVSSVLMNGSAAGFEQVEVIGDSGENVKRWLDSGSWRLCEVAQE